MGCGFFPFLGWLWGAQFEDCRFLSRSLWRDVEPAIRLAQTSCLRAFEFDTVTLDAEHLRARHIGARQVELVLPIPAGVLDRFTAIESPIMVPELATIVCR